MKFKHALFLNAILLASLHSFSSAQENQMDPKMIARLAIKQDIDHCTLQARFSQGGTRKIEERILGITYNLTAMKMGY